MLVLINWINFIASFKRKLFQKVFSRYLHMVILFTMYSYSIPPSPSRYIFLTLNRLTDFSSFLCPISLDFCFFIYTIR